MFFPFPDESRICPSSNVRWILRAALCIDSYTTLSTESELQVDKNYLLKEIYIEYST